MNNIFLKILEEEKAQLLKKLHSLEQAISTYRSTVNEKGNPVATGKAYININSILNTATEGFFQKYSSYDLDAGTRDKILFVIETEKRFLHVREIARVMQLLENEGTANAIIKKISPALSAFKKMPGCPLISIEAGGLHFNTFWGYRQWLQEDGKIDEAFMYNEMEITKKRRQPLAG